MNNVEFVRYDERFLRASWTWLRDKEIKNMTMSPDLDKDSQRSWYEKLNQRLDYFIWGITVDGFPIGAVGIKKINLERSEGEYFGYIGEKSYWGQGIGTLMLQYIIRIAAEKQLDTLILYVTSSNKRAIRLYEKNGFIKNDAKSSNEIHMYYYQLNSNS